MLPETSILGYFAAVEDPRKDKNGKHPLINSIGIALLGVIGGADNGVDIERYRKAKQEGFGTFLDLSHGIPSHDTFGRVFRSPDAEPFAARFIAWTQHVGTATHGQRVAMDGKKLRRSQDRKPGRAGIGMVSACISHQRMV